MPKVTKATSCGSDASTGATCGCRRGAIAPTPCDDPRRGMGLRAGGWSGTGRPRPAQARGRIRFAARSVATVLPRTLASGVRRAGPCDALRKWRAPDVRRGRGRSAAIPRRPKRQARGTHGHSDAERPHRDPQRTTRVFLSGRIKTSLRRRRSFGSVEEFTGAHRDAGSSRELGRSPAGQRSRLQRSPIRHRMFAGKWRRHFPRALI